MSNNVGKRVLVLNSNVLGTLMVNLENKKPPCKFYNSKAGCRFGNECHFSHTRASGGTKNISCKFFNTATGCRFGDHCRFSHDTNVAPASIVEQLIIVHDFGAIIDPQYQQPIASIAENRYQAMIVSVDGVLQTYPNEQLERGYPFIETLAPAKTFDYRAQNIRFKHICTNSDLFIGVFTLCLTRDGKCYSFGANAFGQLGQGNHSDCTVPTLIKTNNFDKLVLKQVCCGSGHSVFLTDSGAVYVAGLNEQGQLGLNEHLDHRALSPVDIGIHKYISEGDHVVKVQCGHDHTLVLTAQGQVYGFGRYIYNIFKNNILRNNRGQLGISETAKVLVPTRIDLPHFIQDVSSVSNHTVFITREKRLFATGDNNYGQTPGAGPRVKYVTEPVEVVLTGQSINSIDKVITGEFFTVIVTNENELYFCGTDMYGLETSIHKMSGFATYNIYVPIKLEVKELRDRTWKIDTVTSGMKHLTVLLSMFFCNYCLLTKLERRSLVKLFKLGLLAQAKNNSLCDMVIVH
jgi:hypothetical protein